MNIANRKFGCLKDPHDERDLVFKMRHKVAELPAAVQWPERISFVWDQADEGSCTGHGVGAAFVNSLRLNRMPDMMPSRQMIYYNGRPDYLKKKDSGACIRDVIKGVNRYGVCPESMWPYLKSNIFQKPSKDCYREAEKHQVLVYESIPKNESEIKSAIAAGYGIVFGILIYESFMMENAARTGIIRIPNSEKEECYGGHCMYAPAYNSHEQGYIDVLNSWGTGWGDKGRCHIPFEYFLEQASDLWAIHLTE